ncbi:MAG: hypothetical protein JWQ81_7828 [Amycolatopsis sp.]|nr:hypothetical protein [Amycolatopsis sp.]
MTALPESQLTADLRTPYCHSPAAARPTNPTKITNLHRRRIQALRHEGGLHDRSQRHTRHTCHISPASHPTRRDRLSDPLRRHQLAPVLAAVEPNPPTSTDQPPDTLRFQASAQDAVKVAFTTSPTRRTHRRNLSSHNTSTRPTWPTVRSTSRWVSTPGTNHSYQGSPDTNRLGSRSLTRVPGAPGASRTPAPRPCRRKDEPASCGRDRDVSGRRPDAWHRLITHRSDFPVVVGLADPGSGWLSSACARVRKRPGGMPRTRVNARLKAYSLV